MTFRFSILIYAIFTLWISNGCTGPHIKLSDYSQLRETPCETIRYFQLAVELGKWSEAAKCLFSEKEDIGGLELWALSGVRTKDLGDVSLLEILVGTYFIDLASESEKPFKNSIVMVMTHPRPQIDMRYDLALQQKNGFWIVNLDKTLELNMPSEQ